MANGNGKKSRKKIIIFSIIGIVLIGLAALVFLGSKRETIITVQTDKVVKRNITQIVSATGKIQPETQVKINAEVSGEITDLPVKEGQLVKKGQLLVRIKPDAYKAQLEQSEASLKMSHAGLAKAEADFRRVEGLYAKQLASDADMDAARATLQSARAQDDQSVSAVNQARDTYAKTTIYSPMDGIVSQLISELGERVSGSTFTLGTQIMTVADLSKMEARVDVGENDIVMVSIGDTSRIQVDAFPNETFVGTVSRIANTATTTGAGTQSEVTNFEVRVSILGADTVQFRPGMSMNADIETESHANVFAVPIQSVTVRMPKMAEMKAEAPKEGEAQLTTGKSKKKEKEEDKLAEIVFVVSDGKAKAVKVKRGISNDTYVEITQGLKEGDEVVSGPFKAINKDLEDGAIVKVDNKKMPATGTMAEKAN
ncbi:MAG TPA: efflux RND transporter periplasmic adaptor subunit [Bacteroidota bacterium]|nr:efflux RND transporter periplasmic adaptor subunit [Bacteroidota bacterium]